MEAEGISEEEVFNQILDTLQANDMSYDSGRILGSMCTKPLELTIKLYQKFFDRNLGDPGLWKGTWKLEREAIKILGTLLHNPDATGYIVTGGTEANIMAMRIARNSHFNGHPEIIVPYSAHASFDKAADLMRLKIIKIPLTSEYTVDTEAVEEAISKNTVAIVGIAGTTALGVVDPIDKLSEIALDHGIYLHVDAAFGGLVLPFLAKMGYHVPPYDFLLEGVQSITADPHKMGLGPIPSGGILFRSDEILKKNHYEIPYLAGGNIRQATIVGTRSGFAAIATWAIFKYLGEKGYIKIVRRCMKLTNLLKEELKKVDGIRVVNDPPQMNVLGFTSDYNLHIIDKRLREKGWALGAFPNLLRIVIMPHIKKCHVENFVRDLESIVQSLK
ncbi:MAG: tyrosine decarboxylase MfnA [Candidatus Helarchaeota archaeon]